MHSITNTSLEHLLTQEFLKEVKSLLAPGGVLAANTFSSSRLYDHESATHASVFPEFFNLKKENRVIIAANGRCRTRSSCKSTASASSKHSIRSASAPTSCLPLFSRKQDWERNARVLTDQYCAGKPAQSRQKLSRPRLTD